MKVRGLLLLAVAIPALSQCIDNPCSVATNFAVDLFGINDTRPNTWGRTDVSEKILTFSTPDGFRVRILRVYGDFLAWANGTVAPGKYAGVLFGLQTTAPEGSKRVSPAADNTLLYLQIAISNGLPVARATFNHNVSPNGLLEEDGIMIVKLASWLNDTGLQIHIEPSFVIVYKYEKEKK